MIILFNLAGDQVKIICIAIKEEISKTNATCNKICMAVMFFNPRKAIYIYGLEICSEA